MFIVWVVIGEVFWFILVLFVLLFWVDNVGFVGDKWLELLLDLFLRVVIMEILGIFGLLGLIGFILF